MFNYIFYLLVLNKLYKLKLSLHYFYDTIIAAKTIKVSMQRK